MKPTNSMSNSMKVITKTPIASPMIAGISYAALWLAIGALTLSALLKWGSLQEEQLPFSSLIVHALAALAGGFVAGRRSGQKGWYYGAILGLAYGILVLIVSFLASDAGLDTRSLSIIGAALAAGAFGGMIGVNMKKQ